MAPTDEPKPSFDTLAVHAGSGPDPVAGSRAQPIHATAAYAFADAEEAAARFAGDAAGPQYGRMHNPTVDAFAARLNALEGGVAGIAFASGQAAAAAALLAVARPGTRVLLSREAFGGTFALFRKWLVPWGVAVTPVAPEADAVAAAMDDDVVAVWVETIANPNGSVPDLEAVATAAHAGGAPLIVDNTWGMGGALCRPLALGADAVVHSATKWIGGHGAFVAGALVDGGSFAWDPVRFPAFHAPDARGRTLVERHGSTALAARASDLGLFTIGATLSPFAAFLALQGLETLPLRAARACASALELAAWLETQPGVGAVRYPGLPSHPSHATARRVLRGGFGAVVAFDLEGAAGAHRVLDALRLVSQVANLGDAKSLAIHPWTTTHAGLDPDGRRAAGVFEGTVRLSVGLEAPDDLRADLAQALAVGAAA